MNNYEIFNETNEKIDIEEEKKLIDFALKHEKNNLQADGKDFPHPHPSCL